MNAREIYYSFLFNSENDPLPASGNQNERASGGNRRTYFDYHFYVVARKARTFFKSSHTSRFFDGSRNR